MILQRYGLGHHFADDISIANTVRDDDTLRNMINKDLTQRS